MISHTNSLFVFSKGLFGMRKCRCVALMSTAVFLFTMSIMAALIPVGLVSAAARQSTMSLNISTDTISVDINPSSEGRFASSSDATIGVSTDNYSGYTLKIVSGGSSDLVNENDDSMESIDSIISESTFSSNSSYNNEWGYKPSQYVSNNTVVNNSNYLPAPSSNGDTLDITNAANSQQNTYTIAIGAKANYELDAGSYSNNFVIMAVANAITYNIYYDENTTDEVDDMPATNPQISEIAGGTATADSYITLSDAVPTRDGYTFAGWCNAVPTEDSTTGNQTCEDDLYDPSDNYGVDQATNNPNIVLYATWTVNQYALTHNYQENYQYRSDGFLNTGYYIDWSKDFKIESTFRIPTLGKRYLIVGNYSDTV